MKARPRADGATRSYLERVSGFLAGMGHRARWRRVNVSHRRYWEALGAPGAPSEPLRLTATRPPVPLGQDRERPDPQTH